MYLALRNLAKKWNSVQGWREAPGVFRLAQDYTSRTNTRTESDVNSSNKSDSGMARATV